MAHDWWMSGLTFLFYDTHSPCAVCMTERIPRSNILLPVPYQEGCDVMTRFATVYPVDLGASFVMVVEVRAGTEARPSFYQIKISPASLCSLALLRQIYAHSTTRFRANVLHHGFFKRASYPTTSATFATARKQRHQNYGPTRAITQHRNPISRRFLLESDQRTLSYEIPAGYPPVRN
jgi:hypothetical protein